LPDKSVSAATLFILIPLPSTPRENELREPIPHIGLCTYHEPRSSIFKRNVIGQIVKTLKTQKLKMTESVGEELYMTFVDEDDDLVLEKCSKLKGRNWDW